MTEIKLTKRYPHSRTEDITDAFMRGYEQGKKDGLKVGKQIVLGAFETYITADRKDEPQTEEWHDDCNTCRWHEGACTIPCCDYEPKTEQTDIHGLTDCDFCKGKNCKDCEGGKDEPQTAECPFDDPIPCEWVCTEYGKCKYKPKTEPNLILPERMERGERYEVGETIVVMNREDYYDLLCKSWKDESHTDTHDEAIKAMATLIKAKTEPQTDKEIILDPSFAELSDEQFVEAMKLIEPQTDCSWR